MWTRIILPEGSPGKLEVVFNVDFEEESVRIFPSRQKWKDNLFTSYLFMLMISTTEKFSESMWRKSNYFKRSGGKGSSRETSQDLKDEKKLAKVDGDVLGKASSMWKSPVQEGDGNWREIG